MNPNHHAIIPEAKIIRAKQNRFTLSSRMLADSGISVSVINDHGQAPADYNLVTKHLRLNEAFPKASNPVEALVYDRGKLFHELGHAKFTRDPKSKREQLFKASHNGKAFLDVSNILEDGRIERLICKEWNGARDYLDCLLAKEIEGLTPIKENGLALYVRTGMYRNKAEETFFAPYQSEIEKAIEAPSMDEVCDIAFEIVQKLYDPQAQNSQPPPQGEGDKQGEGEGEGEGKGKEAEGEENEGRGDSESGKGKAGEESGSQDAGTGEGGSGAGGEEGEETAIDDATQKAIEKIVEEAMQKVEDEAQADYDDILLEAAEMDAGVQEYRVPVEEETADELAQLFTSLLIEINRVKFSQSREGLLNSLALTQALTTRKCFQTRDETLGTPYIALLVDCSGSQSYRMDELTQACRIINGALQKAKINSKIIVYGSSCQEHDVIPVKTMNCMGGTMTHSAMNLANNWLDEQHAERALMIVLTDGAPDIEEHCRIQKDRCEELNGYVLGVRVGFAQDENPYGSMAKQFHTYFNLPDVRDLPRAIEPHIEAFLAGV